MNIWVSRIASIMLGTIFIFSPAQYMAFSSPIQDTDPGSVNGVPPLDYHAYLPLVIHDVNPIPNGNFELGRVSWTEYSSYSGNVLILTSGFPAGVSPHSGSWLAWMGHNWWYPPQDDYISQTVTITSEKPILHFWYWIQSTELDIYHDTFQVLFYDGDPRINWSLDTTTNTSSWAEVAVDLRAYIGKSALLTFYSHNDWDRASHIFLDDISLQKD